MGRKAIYGPDVRELILSRISAGETLRAVCRDEGMPTHQTVVGWTVEDTDFADRYARARSQGLEVLAEETLEIADDVTRDANCRRVSVDTRKWLLSKLRPDKYGERVVNDHNIKGGLSVTISTVSVD